MYSPDHNESLHALIHHLEAQCLEAWRRLRHRRHSLTDALAMAAREVNTDLKRKPGGKISVTISIHGRRSHEDEHYFFMLQMKDFRGYYVVEEVSTQR